MRAWFSVVQRVGDNAYVNLEHFMGLIDPPSQADGLRVLPWLRELARSRAGTQKHMVGVLGYV